ncbi:MAG: hypothetical protein HYT79_03815 [Elusimicrobia bacterium]|nr:hypothetical protein [Elusimicrobiota bacterium]
MKNEFIFSSAIIKQPKGYSALCLDLDVASNGATPEQAQRALYEAVTLYLETAFENNLPHLRPVPRDQDPRFQNPDSILQTFNLRVDFKIQAHA